MVKRMGGDLYTLNDLADLLGESYDTVWYRVTRSKMLVEGEVLIGKRRYYSQRQWDMCKQWVSETNLKEETCTK